MSRLRIAMVAPVAQAVPPVRSGSVETVTALLTDGLVARGHDVTLFAAGTSTTTATLAATLEHGYHDDTSLWPWELCELFNLAAAAERADDFDIIHYQAEYAPIALAFSRLTSTPLLQTVHHAPSAEEVRLWSRFPDAPFIAVSSAQARLLGGLCVAATIHHAVDPTHLTFRPTPDDYLLFLGRFTPGKGVLEAIEVATRSGRRLLLAATENDYYRESVASHVDGHQIVYAGEVDQTAKAALLGGARALIYPVQQAESFGLVLTEAMTCGTPVAALDQGAVSELVDNGVTGRVSRSLDALIASLPAVEALDRHAVRTRALARFGPSRMVDAHVEVYTRLATQALAVPPCPA